MKPIINRSVKGLIIIISVIGFIPKVFSGTVSYTLTCPTAAQIQIRSEAAEYVWHGPDIFGFSTWFSRQNSKAPLASAYGIKVTYYANPGSYLISCYYPTSESTSRLPSKTGEVTYGYGWFNVPMDACQQTGVTTATCEHQYK